MAYRRGLSSQADYYEDENGRRLYEHENDYWHSEAGQYHLKNNAARAEELRARNVEIFRNMTSFYFSNKIVIILIASVVLSLLPLPSNDLVIGVILWNFLIFILLLFYWFVTAKTQVMPEIQDRHQAIMASAYERALGRR